MMNIDELTDEFFGKLLDDSADICRISATCKISVACRISVLRWSVLIYTFFSEDLVLKDLDNQSIGTGMTQPLNVVIV